MAGIVTDGDRGIVPRVPAGPQNRAPLLLRRGAGGADQRAAYLVAAARLAASSCRTRLIDTDDTPSFRSVVARNCVIASTSGAVRLEFSQKLCSIFGRPEVPACFWKLSSCSWVRFWLGGMLSRS